MVEWTSEHAAAPYLRHDELSAGVHLRLQVCQLLLKVGVTAHILRAVHCNNTAQLGLGQLRLILDLAFKKQQQRQQHQQQQKHRINSNNRQ